MALIAERNLPGEQSERQPNQYTYLELRDEVNRLANALRGIGVEKGDRVAIFMGQVPETSVAMLACSRIGAVHCVVFGGFSKEALADRIVDSGSKVVITQDGAVRGGKVVPLKQTLDAALPIVRENGGLVEHTIVLNRLVGEKTTMQPGRDLWWHEVVASQSVDTATEWIDAEDPAFILYTSGSTG